MSSSINASGLTGLEDGAPIDEWSPSMTMLARSLAVLCVTVSFAYIGWRVTATLNWSAWWVSIPFVALEAHLAARLAITMAELWDIHSGPQVAAVDHAPGLVAVFIATYDEGPEVLLPTIAAAVELQPAHETWVLDDGDRAAR